MTNGREGGRGAGWTCYLLTPGPEVVCLAETSTVLPGSRWGVVWGVEGGVEWSVVWSGVWNGVWRCGQANLEQRAVPGEEQVQFSLKYCQAFILTQCQVILDVLVLFFTVAIVVLVDVTNCNRLYGSLMYPPPAPAGGPPGIRPAGGARPGHVVAAVPGRAGARAAAPRPPGAGGAGGLAQGAGVAGGAGAGAGGGVAAPALLAEAPEEAILAPVAPRAGAPPAHWAPVTLGGRGVTSGIKIVKSNTD